MEVREKTKSAATDLAHAKLTDPPKKIPLFLPSQNTAARGS
jgi:hypothetical protein